MGGAGFVACDWWCVAEFCGVGYLRLRYLFWIRMCFELAIGLRWVVARLWFGVVEVVNSVD